MIPNSCLSWLVEKCKKNNNDLNNLTTNIAELTSYFKYVINEYQNTHSSQKLSTNRESLAGPVIYYKHFKKKLHVFGTQWFKVKSLKQYLKNISGCLHASKEYSRKV